MTVPSVHPTWPEHAWREAYGAWRPGSSKGDSQAGPTDNSAESRAEKTVVMRELDGAVEKYLMGCLLKENLEMSCTAPRGESIG